MTNIMNQAPMASQAVCKVTIEAEVHRVWKALIEETPRWWLKDFYSRPNAQFKIEGHLGGRMFEDQGNGCGLIWGNVIGIDPYKSLDIRAYLTSEFGGPALSFMAIRLEAKDNQTIVSVTDTIFGFPSIGTVNSLETGWGQLFHDGLKAYVESGKTN